MFKVNNNLSSGGTGLRGYIEASYKDLVKILGEPSGFDDYKISTHWTLMDDNDNIVTLYDYKKTNLYGDTLPSVEDFREQGTYEWHIGAKSPMTALEFECWLRDKLKIIKT